MVQRLLAPNHPSVQNNFARVQPGVQNGATGVGTVSPQLANTLARKGLEYGVSNFLPADLAYVYNNPLTSAANALGFNTSGTVASAGPIPESALFGPSDVGGNTLAGGFSLANAAVLAPLALISLTQMTEGTQRHETTTGGVVNGGKFNFLDNRNKGFQTPKISEDMFYKDLTPAINNMIKQGANLDGTEIRIGYNYGKEGGQIANQIFDKALQASGLSPVQQVEAKLKRIDYLKQLTTSITATHKAVQNLSKLRPNFKPEELLGKQISADGAVFQPLSVKGIEQKAPKGYMTVTQEMLDGVKEGGQFNSGGLGWVMVKQPGQQDYTKIPFIDDKLTQAVGLKDNPYSKEKAIAALGAVAPKAAAKALQKTGSGPIGVSIPKANATIATKSSAIREKFLSGQQKGKA